MSVYRTNNPLEYALVDGIVIDEKASPPSIKSSGAGVAMLLGRFERGPDDVVSIPTTDVLYQTFGSKDFGGLRQLYNKKFSQLKIKRVRAFDALPSESVLKDPNYVEPQPPADPTPIDINVPVKQLTNDDPTVTFEVEGLIAGEEYTFKTGVQYTAVNNEVVTAKVDSEGEYTFQNADGTEETICTFTASGEKCTITYAGASDEDTMPTMVVKRGVLEATNKVDARLAAPDAIVTFTAKGVGVWGDEIKCEITAATASEKTKYFFVLEDKNYPVEETFYADLDELEGLLKMNSKLVSAKVHQPDYATAIQAQELTFAGGSEGTANAGDYSRCLNEVKEAGIANIVFTDSAGDMAVNKALQGYAQEMQDLQVVISGLPQDVASVVSDVENYRDASARTIYAYPWVNTMIDGVETLVEPASFVASVISQSPAHEDVASVDNVSFLTGITGLDRKLSRMDYIELVDAGVCSFEFDKVVGHKIKSGVTTFIADAQAGMIYRRRMADYMTSSIGNFLINYQNKPNNATNALSINAAITSWDDGQIAAGILPSNAEVQGGDARLIDTSSRNSDESIAEGKFFVVYKRRIYSSMRYIVLVAEIGQSVVVKEA